MSKSCDPPQDIDELSDEAADELLEEPKLMKTSSVDPTLLHQKLTLFQEMLHSPNWNKCTAKNGVEISTFNGEGNQTGFFGSTEVPYGNETIINVLSIPEIPFESNSLHDEIKVLERIGEKTVILYMKFKGMLMVSGRDFVI